MNPWNWRWCYSRAFRAPLGPPGVGVEIMVSIPINIIGGWDMVYTMVWILLIYDSTLHNIALSVEVGPNVNLSASFSKSVLPLRLTRG